MRRSIVSSESNRTKYNIEYRTGIKNVFVRRDRTSIFIIENKFISIKTLCTFRGIGIYNSINVNTNRFQWHDFYLWIKKSRRCNALYALHLCKMNTEV